MQDDVEHRIEFTRNKHSRAVYRDGAVVIRLARNLTRTEQGEHVEYLLRRMRAIAVKERARLAIDPFKPLLDGQSSVDLRTSTGGTHRFTLQAGKRTRAVRTPEGWRVEVGPRTRRRELHRFLWKILSATELPRLRALVLGTDDATFRAGVRSVRVRYAASLWGSCSSRGDILLNAALLFVPEGLLRYVIVHELAHRLVRSHSRAFWRQVERFSPEHLFLRKEMRKFRICAL